MLCLFCHIFRCLGYRGNLNVRVIFGADVVPQLCQGEKNARQVRFRLVLWENVVIFAELEKLLKLKQIILCIASIDGVQHNVQIWHKVNDLLRVDKRYQSLHKTVLDRSFVFEQIKERQNKLFNEDDHCLRLWFDTWEASYTHLDKELDKALEVKLILLLDASAEAGGNRTKSSLPILVRRHSFRWCVATLRSEEGRERALRPVHLRLARASLLLWATIVISRWGLPLLLKLLVSLWDDWSENQINIGLCQLEHDVAVDQGRLAFALCNQTSISDEFLEFRWFQNRQVFRLAKACIDLEKSL